MDHALTAAQQFTPQGRVLEVREYGSGNVNDTFLVTVGRVVRGTHPTFSFPKGGPDHGNLLLTGSLTENRKQKTENLSGQPPDSEGESRFILQRLNTRVFQRPELVMGNLRAITEHVRERLSHILFAQIKALSPVRRRPYEVFGPGSRGAPASIGPTPVSAYQYSRDLFSLGYGFR
jgi:hypothetical protein